MEDRPLGLGWGVRRNDYLGLYGCRGFGERNEPCRGGVGGVGGRFWLKEARPNAKVVGN